MLVIRIELWPFGDEAHKKEIGIAHIANIGGHSESPRKGHYVMRIFKEKSEKVWKECGILDFPRQKLGPWDLLFRGLRNLVGDRNKEDRENGKGQTKRSDV